MALAQVTPEQTNGYSAPEGKVAIKFLRKAVCVQHVKSTLTMNFQVIISAKKDRQNDRSSHFPSFLFLLCETSRTFLSTKKESCFVVWDVGASKRRRRKEEEILLLQEEREESKRSRQEKTLSLQKLGYALHVINGVETSKFTKIQWSDNPRH